MTEAKSFPLGDILSVTTGYLVSRDHIDGVYRVCNYMTGDNLFTHQLPRACEECAPEILKRHPALAGIEVPEFNAEDAEDRKAEVYAWLSIQEEAYGAELPLTPLDSLDHTVIDPISELKMMRPEVEVIAVEVRTEDHV